jgi:hypothetical protein
MQRENIERAYRQGTDLTREGPQASYRTLLVGLHENHLEAVLSSNECDLIIRPLGLWTAQELIDVSWRPHPLACFLWALSLLDELPPYDRPINEEVVVRMAVGEPSCEFIARRLAYAFLIATVARPAPMRMEPPTRFTAFNRAGRVIARQARPASQA